MRHLFQVGGMRCASCQAHVAKAVKAVPGVLEAEVNLITGRMTAETDDAPDMARKIVDAVKNAGFTAEVVEESPAPVKTAKCVFQVGGMRCASCQAHVAKAVKAVPGVLEAEVNLITGRMTVKCDGAPDMPRKIVDAVKNAGFTAEVVEESPAAASEPETVEQPKTLPKKVAAIPDPARELFRQFIWSAILMLPLMYFSFSSMHGFLKNYPLDAVWLQLVFLIPLLYVNRVYFISGARRFLKFSPNMDSLIMLGSGASVLYSLVMTGEMLLGKMDAYCRQQIGATLSDYREQLLAEEQDAAMEAPSM